MSYLAPILAPVSGTKRWKKLVTDKNGGLLHIMYAAVGRQNIVNMFERGSIDNNSSMEGKTIQYYA